MLSNACPKVKPGTLTRAEAKEQKRLAEARAVRACYLAVDLRDRCACRLCGRLTSPRALSLDKKTIRHHMVYRSMTSDPHRSDNVVTVCRFCNDAIHVTGTLRVTGDADLRDERGRFCGLVIERLTESGWAVDVVR